VLLFTFSLEHSFLFVVGLLGSFSQNDLVETGQHVTSSDVFEGETGLDEQATLRDLDDLLLPVASPHRQARVAAFTVDSHKADIVMETSKDSSDLILLKIRTSGGQKMCTTLHPLREGILWHVHANGSHLSDGVDSRVKLATPLVHFILPFGETLRNHLREVISRAIRSLSNFPHESPLSIQSRLKRTLRHVFSIEVQLYQLLLVVTSRFNEFWCGSYLVVALGNDVSALLASVELVARLLEVVLHQVNVGLVVLHVDTWVLDQQDTEFVEALLHFFAFDLDLIGQVCMVVAMGCFQVQVQINDWHVVKV